MYRSPFIPHRFPDAGEIPEVDISSEARPVLERLRKDPPVGLSLADADPAEQAAALARAIFDHEEARAQLDLPDDRMDLPVALHHNDPILLNLLDTARIVHASNPEGWPEVFQTALEAVSAETRTVMALPPDQQIARDITNQTIGGYSMIYDDLPGGPAPDRMEHRYQGILNPGTLRSAPGTIWVPPVPGTYIGTLPVVPTNMPDRLQYEIQPIDHPDTGEAWYRVALREGNEQGSAGAEVLAEFPSQESAQAFVQHLQAHGPALEALDAGRPVRAAGAEYTVSGYAPSGEALYAPNLPEDGTLRPVPASELAHYLKTGKLSLELAGNALHPEAQPDGFDQQSLRHFAEQNVANAAFYRVVPEGESLRNDRILDFVRSRGRETPEYRVQDLVNPATGESSYALDMVGLPRDAGSLSRHWALPQAPEGVLRIGTFPTQEDAQAYRAWLTGTEMRELQAAVQRGDPQLDIAGTTYAVNEGEAFATAQGRSLPRVSRAEIARYAYTGILSPEMGVHRIEAQDQGYQPSAPERQALARFTYEAGTTGAVFRESDAIKRSYLQSLGETVPGPALHLGDVPPFVQQYVLEHRFDSQNIVAAENRMPDAGRNLEVTESVPTASPQSSPPMDAHGPRPDPVVASPTLAFKEGVMQMQKQFYPNAQGNPTPVSMILLNDQPLVAFQTDAEGQQFLNWMQENAARRQALEKGEAMNFGNLQYVPAGVPGEYRAVLNGRAVDRQIIDQADLQAALETGKLSPELYQQWERHAQELDDPGMQCVLTANRLNTFSLEQVLTLIRGNPSVPPPQAPVPENPSQGTRPSYPPVPDFAASTPTPPAPDTTPAAPVSPTVAAAAAAGATAGATAAAAAPAPAARPDMEFEDEAPQGAVPGVQPVKGGIIQSDTQAEPAKGQVDEVQRQDETVKQTQEQRTAEQKQHQDRSKDEQSSQEKDQNRGQGQAAAGPSGFHLFGPRVHNHYHTHQAPQSGGGESAEAPASAPSAPAPASGGLKPAKAAAANLNSLDVQNLQSTVQEQHVTAQEVRALNQKIVREGLTPENQQAAQGLFARKDATLKQVGRHNYEENQRVTKALDDLGRTIQNDQTPNVDPSVRERLARAAQDFARAVGEALARLLAALTGRGRGASTGPSM